MFVLKVALIMFLKKIGSVEMFYFSNLDQTELHKFKVKY